ncbi:MAG TPA: MFS transporter [Mycobacteriales bacterium]|nr:MFS transporter [Mycobacteriales bacterium]
MTSGSPVVADPRRWQALGVLGLIQFMLVLDITVVNVALPHIQRSLGFSSSGLAWVVNGYVVMAGGLLLLGGRLADIVGRKRIFLIGVAVFAVASATCGAATDPGVLVASRFLQGSGEALAAPASMGLIALLFPDPQERIKALGLWGGIAGLGGTSGTVISGFFVNYLSWRWIFYINLPVAIFALIVVPGLVKESKMVRGSERPDFAGAITGTGGLIAVVDGLLAASNHPWGSARVLVPLIGGLALLGLMVFIESRSDAPLIPLSFFDNRTRVTTNVTTLFFSSGFFSYFFLLTLYEQKVLHYSAIRSGLSYLPFGLTIGAGIGIGTAIMPRVGVKRLLGCAFLTCAAGMLLSSRISPESGYWTDIVPGMIVLGFGSGLSFPGIGNASLHEVTVQDSSLASGVQSAFQQVGGALGLFVFVTLAIRHATSLVDSGSSPPVAVTAGYALAYRVAAATMVVGAILVFALLENVLAVSREAEAAPHTGAGATAEIDTAPA